MPSERLIECILAECEDLDDYSPLVTVLSIATEEFLDAGGSFETPRARRAWINIMKWIRDEESSNHNSRLPCRFCDKAFTPRADNLFLTAFLEWYSTRETSKLIALHRCPACGGHLTALDTQKYEGDSNTPQPSTIEDDKEWVKRLLSNCD